MLHALNRKIADFPQGPSRRLRSEFSQADLPSQRLTDLRIDEVRCPQHSFFGFQPLFDNLRIRPIAKEFNENRCVDDGHQSPRDSRMISTSFWVLRVEPALRPLLLAPISRIVDLRLFRSSSCLM